MSTAVNVENRIRHVAVTDETITMHLVDGRVISVPLAWSWRLSDATPAQRANWQLVGEGHGAHWPDVDEDLSADGLLHGVPASRPRRASTELRAPEKAPQLENHRQHKVKPKTRSRATRG